MRSALIEPELRSLWLNCSVGDLFALPTVTAPKSPPSLPTIHLNSVNRTMLRKLPEVVNAPIHSCAKDESFYTKIVCQHYATKYTSTPKPLTQHQRENPFGSFYFLFSPKNVWKEVFFFKICLRSENRFSISTISFTVETENFGVGNFPVLMSH